MCRKFALSRNKQLLLAGRFAASSGGACAGFVDPRGKMELLLHFPGDFIRPAVSSVCCLVAVVSPSGIRVKLHMIFFFC